MRPLFLLGFATLIIVTKGFLASFFLNVNEFASYSIGLVWAQVGVILLSFGSITNVQLETTINIEKNNSVSISEDFSKSLSLIISNFFFMSLIVLILYFSNKEFLVPGLIGVFLGALQSFFLLFTTLTKSKQDFNYYGIISLLKSFLVISSISLFGFLMPNYESLFFAEILALLIVLFFVFKKEFYRSDFSLSIKKLNLSWYREYLSLFIVSLSAVAFSSFDRLIAISKLGIEEIATLGFIALFYSAALMFQSTLNSIVFPYMTKINISQGKAGLIKFSAKLTLAILVVFFFIIISVYNFGGDLITNSFNKYSVSFNIVILSALTASLKASDFLSNIFLIIKKENFITMIRIIILVFVCIYLLICGAKVFDFVIALCFAMLLYKAILFVSLWRIYEHHK